MLENLHHFGDDAVQKIAVMRYDHNRSLIVHQKSLQPPDRFHIQMVGRLVQKQDVRLCHKELPQRHARLLTSGKLAHLPVKFTLRKAESL